MSTPLAQLDAKIVGVKQETRDTRTLTLSLSSGEKLDYAPGQFNMVGVVGVGEVPVSISSVPDSTETFKHTVRDVGSVTGVLCGLDEGKSVCIRGPYGIGWPMEEARGSDLVLVAGGIGLAPLRSVILRVIKERKSYGRLNIVYGARTPEDMLFTDEYEDWCGQEDCKVLLSADRVSDPGRWDHRIGVVLTSFDDLDANPYDSVIMTCGPEIMMRFVVRGLIHRGFSTERIYVSMERRMRCGIGHCGHCQLGPKYVCLDGPVFRYVDLKTYPDSII
jgi:sulfhydrogenase subunit gamma (sulfur reductase)